jgi:hypothetical protein
VTEKRNGATDKLKHKGSGNLREEIFLVPVTVAERSKACTVFARSEAGIVVSNSTQVMDV